MDSQGTLRVFFFLFGNPPLLSDLYQWGQSGAAVFVKSQGLVLSKNPPSAPGQPWLQRLCQECWNKILTQPLELQPSQQGRMWHLNWDQSATEGWIFAVQILITNSKVKAEAEKSQPHHSAEEPALKECSGLVLLLPVISRVRNQQQTEITNGLNIDYISHSGGIMKFSILSSTERNRPAEESGCEVSCTLTGSQPWNMRESNSMSGTLGRCQHIIISHQSELHTKIKCYLGQKALTFSSHSSIKDPFYGDCYEKHLFFHSSKLPALSKWSSKVFIESINNTMAQKLFTNHNAK